MLKIEYLKMLNLDRILTKLFLQISRLNGPPMPI